MEIGENLFAVDLTSVEAGMDIAKSYAGLGYVYSFMASEARGDERVKRWQEAQTLYQRSHDILREMREQGALPGGDSESPDKIAREIAKCAAALAK